MTYDDILNHPAFAAFTPATRATIAAAATSVPTCDEALTIVRDYIAPGPRDVRPDLHGDATVALAFDINRDHEDARMFHEVCPHCGC